MGVPRYAARRDRNEPALILVAEQLGWKLWKLNEPCDWIGLRRGRFHLIEIKHPDCEGHADEFTPQQRIFHRDVENCGGKVLIWRRDTDVMRDSGAR